MSVTTRCSRSLLLELRCGASYDATKFVGFEGTLIFFGLLLQPVFPSQWPLLSHFCARIFCASQDHCIPPHPRYRPVIRTTELPAAATLSQPDSFMRVRRLYLVEGRPSNSLDRRVRADWK